MKGWEDFKHNSSWRKGRILLVKTIRKRKFEATDLFFWFCVLFHHSLLVGTMPYNASNIEKYLRIIFDLSFSAFLMTKPFSECLCLVLTTTGVLEVWKPMQMIYSFFFFLVKKQAAVLSINFLFQLKVFCFPSCLPSWTERSVFVLSLSRDKQGLPTFSKVRRLNVTPVVST